MQDKIDVTQIVKEFRIQISNICNYSNIHKKCPASKYEKVVYLPISYIESILDQLREINYNGDIGFHIYNEPFCDSRLYHIVYLARKHLSNNKIILWTNQIYFSDEILQDYLKLNNINFTFSDYSVGATLDDRMKIYEPTTNKRTKKCCAPYYQININCDGDIVLCCYDWQNVQKYGNIKEKKLIDILNSEKMKKDYTSLLQGKCFGFCNNCKVDYETV